MQLEVANKAKDWNHREKVGALVVSYLQRKQPNSQTESRQDLQDSETDVIKSNRLQT